MCCVGRERGRVGQVGNVFGSPSAAEGTVLFFGGMSLPSEGLRTSKEYSNGDGNREVL